MAGRRFRAAGPAAVALLATVLSGCALYSSKFEPVQSELAAQHFDAALKKHEDIGTSSTDEVVFLLNKAMLQRMNGDLAGSNATFESAKALMDELDATSVSETTLSFIVNDSTQSYVGEEYEQVLVHLYAALNYLELGKLDEARVEALQVDVKLKGMSNKIAGNAYADDAFARYLTALIYEENREWSDAMIAYRKAYEAYKQYARAFNVPVPQVLKEDLVRYTDYLGLRDENRRYRKEFGIDKTQGVIERSELGEVVFILHNGLAPVKREHATTVPDLATGLMFRVSLPYYETQTFDARTTRLTVKPATATPGIGPELVYRAQTEQFENIDAIARANLDSKMAGISARAVARAAAKISAARAALEAGRRSGDRDAAWIGLIAGVGLSVAGAATERADTRSWLTLPHDIQLARIALPPGKYDVKVELRGGVFRVLREYSVTLEAGRKRYLSYHYVSPAALSGSGR